MCLGFQSPVPRFGSELKSAGLAPLQHGVEVDNLQDSQMALLRPWLPGLASGSRMADGGVEQEGSGPASLFAV